jgi:hypothetical protein
MYSFRHNFSNVRSLYEITRSETSETIKILKDSVPQERNLCLFVKVSFVHERKKELKKTTIARVTVKPLTTKCSLIRNRRDDHVSIIYFHYTENKCMKRSSYM